MDDVLTLDDGRIQCDVCSYDLDDSGHCRARGTLLPGVYDGAVGSWGPRRLPVYVGGWT